MATEFAAVPDWPAAGPVGGVATADLTGTLHRCKEDVMSAGSNPARGTEEQRIEVFSPA